jgi:hypothetical protein
MTEPTDTAKEVVEVRRHLDELRYHFLPVRHDEKAAHVVERTIALITALQSRIEALEKSIPAELFDGYAVLKAIPESAHVSADHVALVLDAVVTLLRKRTPTPQEAP